MVGHALILNASFEPLNIVCWQRAIQLIFQGKVEVIEESDRIIRTVRMAFRMPLVIRLIQYVPIQKRKNVIRFSRVNVFLRDSYKCQYCGTASHKNKLTLDHVVPVVQGGKRSWENIVTACKPCNQKKGGRTPQEARMALVRKPKTPEWLASSTFEHLRVPLPEIWRMYLERVQHPVLLQVEEPEELDWPSISP